MRLAIIALGIPVLVGITACSSTSEREAKLRAALDKAELSLSNSVAVAETETTDGVGVSAKLLVDAEPVFSVGALATSAFKDVRVNIVSGKVLSMQVGSGAPENCAGAISLADTLAIAETYASGDAVAIGPDDDGQCNREVQVLRGETLWEVKVGPNGSVIESEESDDDEGED